MEVDEEAARDNVIAPFQPFGINFLTGKSKWDQRSTSANKNIVEAVSGYSNVCPRCSHLGDILSLNVHHLGK